MRKLLPPMPQTLLWEADFEIERDRFSQAGALIKEAQSIGTVDSNLFQLPERRQARLLFATGRFAEAQKIALEGCRWDGKTVAKLKIRAAMNLVTLGEVVLARGDFATAISILEKASAKSRNVSSLDGLDWIRSRNDIAIAENGLGSIQAALEAAKASAAAELEWALQYTRNGPARYPRTYTDVQRGLQRRGSVAYTFPLTARGAVPNGPSEDRRQLPACRPLERRSRPQR
jgi:tetratricopeptide (TPR) repeat protein